MSERFTLDANVLFCAVDRRHPVKEAAAKEILARARAERWAMTLQAIGEFYHSTTRRLVLSRADAAVFAEDMLVTFDVVATTTANVRVALQQAAAQRLSYWDALLVATAADAGCTICLSEDMQDGFRFGSIEIVNPFGPNGLSARAARLLAAGP